jgi:hypothetical protein
MGLSIGNRGDKFTVPVPINALTVDSFVWVAPVACKLLSVTEVHAVASTSGTLGIRKITADSQLPGATAGASVVELLTSATAINLASTASTVVTAPLSTVSGALNVPSGARIGFDIAGTMTNLAGGVVTMTFQAS